MKKILDFQMSTFGSFENIKVDASLVAKLLEAFDNQFMPSVIPAAIFDPFKSAPTLSNRLNMISSDHMHNIFLLPERIDCNFTPQDESSASMDFKTAFNKPSEFLKIAMNELDVLGNRFAINGRYLIDCIVDANSFFKPTGFYKEKTLSEWSTSANQITSFDLNGKKEELNNILAISFSEFQNSANNTSSILISFDINTLHVNNKERFSSKDVDEFLNNAISNLDKMISDLPN